MRKLALFAAAAALAATPVLAQTQQQRARAAEGQTDTENQAPASPNAATDSTARRAEVLAAPEFARAVAMSDRYELVASHLAIQRSSNAEIRSFAERMIRDHQKSAAEFQRLLAEMPGQIGGAAAPRGGAAGSAPEATGLDQQHQALLLQLERAEGAAFDRLYIRQQVVAHQQAVDMVRNYAASGDNARLRQWASGTLPALQAHQQMAMRLQQAIQG